MAKVLRALGILITAAAMALPVLAQYRASTSGPPRTGMPGISGQRGGSAQPRMGRRGGARIRTGGPRGLHAGKPNLRPQSSTVSLADLQAPKKARKAYEKFRQQLSKGEVEKAEASLRRAIELYPSYPSAWTSLGRMLSRQGKPEEAKAAYRTALEADPKSWRSWAGLAAIGYAEENWTEVAKATERATHLMPLASPRLWVYQAVANYSLGNYDKAEESANDVLERGGWYIPKAYHVLGLVHAQRDQFELAAQHLQRFLKIAPHSQDAPLVRKQLAYVRDARQALGVPVPPSRPLNRNTNQ